MLNDELRKSSQRSNLDSQIEKNHQFLFQISFHRNGWRYELHIYEIIFIQYKKAIFNTIYNYLAAPVRNH